MLIFERRVEVATYSAGSNIFLRTTQLLAILTLTGKGFVSVLGLQDLASLIAAIGGWCRFICSGKFPHQCISTIVVEVHTTNIRVIQGTSTTGTFIIVSATSTVEIATGTSLGDHVHQLRRMQNPGTVVGGSALGISAEDWR